MMNSMNYNYGVIGNCRSAALVSDRGSIDWCCLPDFDSPSVFAKLLDSEKGGHFGFTVDDDCTITQTYLGWTNILRTEFKTAKGAFEVFDFMPRYITSDNSFFTPAEIYRFIRPISGTPTFAVSYCPAFNYAGEEVSHVTQEDHIRSYSRINPIDCLFLYTSLPLDDILEAKEMELTQPQFMLLSYNQKVIDIDINRVNLEFQRTKVYWLNWSNRANKYEKYNEEIIRSLLALKMLTFQPTGAVLAAVTTSLPEAIGETRNWDYRFCWLRDASMSIEILLDMGYSKDARNFLTFIKRILKSKHDTYQIMYGIRGERELIEMELPHLSGYMSSKPVRTGNAAYYQQQNDVYGYLLNVIHQYYKFFPGTLDEVEDIWEIVRNIMRTVTTQWEKPDKGIWEIRSGDQHFVFSKVMCWVAMDRASKIALLLNKTYYAENWSGIANDIKEDVYTNGWNEDLQTFTQTYSNTDVDASLLLMGEYGFIEADDVRYHKTVLAIKNALCHNGLMYRYVNSDDFGLPSSSFTVCTFWLIQAMYRIGMKEEAEGIFVNLLTFKNHVGLYSECIDFTTKRLLGNFPQAYSFLALINTATLFSDEKFRSKFIKP